jgi:hypothetical protein
MMNAREKKRVELEKRYVFMMGYQRGFRDALPMHSFVGALMELMDPQMAIKTKKWAEDYMKTAMTQHPPLTPAGKRLMAKSRHGPTLCRSKKDYQP